MSKFLKSALVFACLFVAAVVGKYVSNALFDRSNVSEAALEEQLLSEDIRLFSAIKNNFPDEFRVLILEFEKIIDEGGDSDKIRAESARETMRIRKKYAGNVALSRDEDLVKLILISNGIHQEIYDQEGFETCNKLAINGPASIGNIIPKYIEQFDEQAAVYIETVGYAEKNPAPNPGDASEDDWGLVENLMVEKGTPDNYLKLIVYPDLEDPELCPALIAMNNALVEIPGDAGRRLRVALVTVIVGN